jgi:hypothetical protein
MSAGHICSTAFCLVPGPIGIHRFFDCVYPLPAPCVEHVLKSAWSYAPRQTDSFLKISLISLWLFIVSVTGSRIFVRCQLLSSRRVDNWVSTYYSWEQPRSPYAISNSKAPAHICRPDQDPTPIRRQVLRGPTPRPVASSSKHPTKTETPCRLRNYPA